MDLSLVSMDDLIAEIDKRADTVVILTHKDTSAGDVHDWHLKGNRITCLGLCDLTAESIRRGYEADETGGFSKD